MKHSITDLIQLEGYSWKTRLSIWFPCSFQYSSQLMWLETITVADHLNMSNWVRDLLDHLWPMTYEPVHMYNNASSWNTMIGWKNKVGSGQTCDMHACTSATKTIIVSIYSFWLAAPYRTGHIKDYEQRYNIILVEVNLHICRTKNTCRRHCKTMQQQLFKNNIVVQHFYWLSLSFLTSFNTHRTSELITVNEPYRDSHS